MERPNRATVVAYSFVLAGAVTMVQYSGVTSDPTVTLPAGEAQVLSSAITISGGLLIVLGIAVASRPNDMRDGTERAPAWLLVAAGVETVGCAGLLGSALI